MIDKKQQDTTDFGFQEVPTAEKVEKVAEVFRSVASRYDVMNDVMSFGLHRLWKDFAIKQLMLKSGMKVLDLAGGTGDLTARMSPLVGEAGKIVLSDINEAMLKVGRSRLLDKGIFKNIEIVQANAETLPFEDSGFDRVIIGFGLRNVTEKDKALSEMYRVLKPGGMCIVLEFSKPKGSLLNQAYDFYSFKILPKLGRFIAKDEDSYRYLAESIRKHPNQEVLKDMMCAAGFEDVMCHNLAAGIVAVHVGRRH